MNKNFEKSARGLVGASHVFAISSYTTYLDKYPILAQVNPEHYDVILTIGSVFVAISRLNHEGISEDEKDKALETITNSFKEIYPSAVDAFEDCRNFVDRTYDGLSLKTEYMKNPEYLFSDSLGGWVVWNLFEHAPENEEERELVRVLGVMLVSSFISWWK